MLVDHRLHQDTVAAAIQRLFDHVELVDRRASPSHGYRAVHLVVQATGKLVEVQLRTALEHLWAELSERMSDKLGASIKYGGGDVEAREELWESSEVIGEIEKLEHHLMLSYSSLAGLRPEGLESEDLAALTGLLGTSFTVDDVAGLVDRKKRDVSDYLIDSIMSLGEGEQSDFSH